MDEKITAVPYAIFKSGGKQYQAIPGKTIAIEKLKAEPGDTVTFDTVLLRKTVSPTGQEVVEIGQPTLQKPIKASILKHARNPKIIVFRFKRRKKYKRTTGHRQPYTLIRILEI